MSGWLNQTRAMVGYTGLESGQAKPDQSHGWLYRPRTMTGWLNQTRAMAGYTDLEPRKAG